ncbi:MAG: hypothetical protein WBB17_05690 [Saprospiraceae bacterium]|nr:hypothetical protein [Saprospiraceae bacterium]
MDSEILSHYNIRASTKSTALFHLYNLDEATLGSIELKTDEKKQAEIIIGENKYEIIQPSIWESKYSVLLNKDTVATLKINSLNLNTEIKILGKKPIEYKLEILSFWKYNYKLSDAQGQLLFFLTPKLNWKTMNYTFSIAYHHIFESYEEKELLFFITTFQLLAHMRNSTVTVVT